MKTSVNNIRVGWIIEHNGKQWTVMKTQVTKPGKGGAFMQVEMRDLASGNKTNERFRTEDTIEKLTSENVDYQYLYSDGDKLYFMNKENYEQIELPSEILGENVAFLQDNMDVVANLIEGKVVGIELPLQVVCTVVETEPYLKGQTVTTSYKPAILDNGLRTTIPPFITTGEKIVVATADCSYVERAK